MNWRDFSTAAPELAALGRLGWDAQSLCLVGTLRRDGWPRVSPCEIYFVGDEMLLGMMPNSRKARDLQRDPRVTVVTPQALREPVQGDTKIYGRAIEITDEAMRDAYADVVEAAIDWRPSGGYHLFAVEVLSASYISFGRGARALRWTAERGVEDLPHPG